MIEAYRRALIEKLEDHGIPDNGLTLKEAKKSYAQYMGWYQKGSQLRNRPIIYIDIDRHVSELRAIGQSSKVHDAILATMLEEYAHIIEEFIGFDNRANGNQYFDVLYEQFNEVDNFGKLFSLYIQGLPGEHEETIKEIISFYCQRIFNPTILESIKKPRWQRQIESISKRFEKSFPAIEKKGTLAICEKFFEHMTGDVKILRLKKDSDIHHVLIYEHHVIDVEQISALRCCTFKEIFNQWESVEEYKIKNNPLLAKNFT